MNQIKVNGTQVPKADESASQDLSGPSMADLAVLEDEVRKIEEELRKETELEEQERKERERLGINIPLTGRERYMIPFNNSRLLPHSTIVKLAQRRDRGDEGAVEQIIMANLRLARKIARTYVKYGVPLEDLCQEAVTVGLRKAALKYDWRKGHKFSTYAAWWVRHACYRALPDQGPDQIIIREWRLQAHYKARRTARALQIELGREPSIQEIVDESEVRPDLVAEAFSKVGTVACSIHDIITHHDGDSVRGDIILDENAPDPSVMAGTNEILAHLESKIARLMPAVRGLEPVPLAWHINAFALYYGLEGNSPHVYKTFTSLALACCLASGGKSHQTRQRVCQVITGICYRLVRDDPGWLLVIRALEVRGEKRSSVLNLTQEEYRTTHRRHVEKLRKKRHRHLQRELKW